MKELYGFGAVIALIILECYFSFLLIGDLIKLSVEWINDDSKFHEPFLRDAFPFDKDDSIGRSMLLVFCIFCSLFACLAWPIILLALSIYATMHFSRFIVRLKKNVDKISKTKLSEEKYESYDPEFVKWKQDKGI